MSNLAEIVRNQLPKKKILIVGDLVADQFLGGTIARVSREAPVFILRHDHTETFGGGAANTAVNIAALGAKPLLVGVTGSDANGDVLRNALQSAGVGCEFVASDPSIRTTTKVRVLAGQHYAPRQQVIRIDYENETEMSSETRRTLIERTHAAAKKTDAIILSDYNYGVVDQAIAGAAREAASVNKIPLIVDSRFRLPEFPNATSATPNQEEVEQILGKGFTDDMCEELRARLGYAALLITCGNEGMILVENGQSPKRFDAVGSVQPVDVTGAGDTVIAVYALALACECTFSEAARIANHAGGIVVMKRGTASVTPDELIASLSASKGTAVDTASKRI
jgi:rfaE bifunctional protein kinase chain/domain